MCSEALKSNDNYTRGSRPTRSAARNVRSKIKPKPEAHSNKSRMLSGRSLDRVHAHGDENCCVTRIRGKWAFSILTQLQHGPTQLSQLGSTLPRTSRKKLTEYVGKLQKAGLIVARSGRMPQAEYVLSDPLGMATAHLINALAQSTEEAPEREPKHRC